MSATTPGANAKIAPGDPRAWAGARWMRVVEENALPENLVPGVEMARLGRVRDMTIAAGRVSGVVQEKPGYARAAEIGVAVLTHAQWERITDVMADQAVHAAKLLAGELPPTIEDLIAPTGLRLFPAETSEMTPTCACSRKGGWCKHATAVAAAFGDRLAREPLSIFELRGISAADLLDTLRERRHLAESDEGVFGPGAGAAALRRTGGGSGLDPGPALEECLDSFWDAGPGLDEIDTTPRPPEVKHALLRRLGPSPFGAGQGSFPLIGLLASCYDAISEAALREDDSRTDPLS